MAKQRPSLGVTATPVNTYVAPVAAAVELYDQQSVNLALEFSNAFKDLSLTAANFVGQMKKQQNQEELQAGLDMVNTSQKTYQQLVETGQIKPSENPWMAVGAQQASGSMEALKARSQFISLYNQKAAEDPTFLDSADGFNALAASYSENVNRLMANNPYQSRAFFEGFNPFVASMAVRNEEQVVEVRRNKILTGVQAAVAQAVQDISSPDPTVSGTALQTLQQSLDESGQLGVSRTEVNEAAAKAFVDLMPTTDNLEGVEALFGNVQTAPGSYLKDTNTSKALLGANRARIEANRQRDTAAKNRAVYDFVVSNANGVISDKDLADKIDALSVSQNATSAKTQENRIYALRQNESARNELERKAKEDQQNFVSNFSFEAARSVPPEFADLPEEQYQALMEERLLEAMDKSGVPAAERGRYLSMQDSFMQKYGKERMVARYKAGTILYEQESGQAFLNETFNFVAQGGVELPEAEQYRTQANERMRTVLGVSPESGEAKNVYLAEYARYDSLLRKTEESEAQRRGYASLTPLDTDSPAVRKDKAALRGRFMAIRLDLGRTFGSNEQISRVARSFDRVLNPQAVEGGLPSDIADAEDAIWAYRYMLENGRNLDEVVPSGVAGKALKEEMLYAFSQMRQGYQPSDILRDITSRKYLGQTTQLSFLDLQNEFSWANIATGNSNDAVTLSENFMRLRTESQITNPDAQPYLTSKYVQAYRTALGSSRNHREAMEQAATTVKDSFIAFRGSALPASAFPYEAMRNPKFLADWMDNRFAKDVTLVVVAEDADGVPMMAVRDAQGRAVADKDGQFRYYRPEDLVPSEQEIMDFARNLETQRVKDAEQRKNIRKELLQRYPFMEVGPKY
jgi:hypothetical protein